MRLEGWEKRLGDVIEAARHAQYRLGEHDCFRVVCQAVEALTGVDRWPEFAGKYSTKREAMVLIAKYGSSFDAAFSWFFGGPPRPARLAEAGDVAKFIDDTGEAHLGVCIDDRVALLREGGLVFASREACGCSWRVG